MQEPVMFFFFFVLLACAGVSLPESLSKHEVNGKDNARKQWSDWLNEKNNRAARAARTFECLKVEFSDVICQTTTWNFQI